MVRSLMAMAYEVVTYPSFHPYFTLKKRALAETADYISAHMPQAVSTYSTKTLMDLSLKSVSISGEYLEFGVFKGGSITYISKQVKSIVHGFDSFEGLSADWTGTVMKKGDFTLKNKLPKVPDNVRLYSGWFDKTLPLWIEKNSGNVAFIHVDCDLYSSTKTIFDLLAPKISRGTVIVFDEYFNYPNWKNHEYKAFQEFVTAHSLQYEYLAYSYFQVAVKIV
jgi:hypothetical protein